MGGGASQDVVIVVVSTHHGRHGEALEQEAFAAVTVPLKDHEVSVVAHLPAQRPVGQGEGSDPRLPVLAVTDRRV